MRASRVARWADGGDPEPTAYHDSEWGVPSHDDVHLFELLVLEGAQAGLSWTTILRKRAGYCAAFADFDVDRVARYTARYTDRDVRRLLGWFAPDSKPQIRVLISP